jgi:murein DD-endopeptidase MepM/ murein hydrolase activator NlpD
LTKLLSSGFENIKSFAKGVAESASNLAGKVSSWFSEKVISGVNIAKDISSKIGNFVSSVVQNITSGISSFFEGVKNFFADIGQKIVSDPIGTIKTLVIGFKDIINTIIQKAVKGPSGGAKDSRPPAPPSATKPDVGFIPVRSAAADPRHPGSLPSIGPSSDIVGVYQNVVRAAVGDYPVTQLIGQNRPYYDSKGNLVNPMGYGRYGHMGIDVATPLGTPVRAPFSGVVVDASGGAWGKSIYLVGRNVALRFSHLSSIDVPSGSIVKAGQIIAKTGNTGNSTGPHLDITAYTAKGGKVGTWISNYQVINRLVSSEIGGKPLSEKELAELQSKVREGLPKIQQAAFDQNLVPVTSSFGLALQNIAERAASLLGLDSWPGG